VSVTPGLVVTAPDCAPVSDQASSIEGVRFRIVLFDLDGTLIDSGPIILASMQHAVRTVLDRDIGYEELAATVGGQGLVSQMEQLGPDRVDELVEVYREHNDPLHETLEAFDGMMDVLPQLRAEGRRLGIVTAKRHRTVDLAFARFPWLAEQFDVVVAHDDTERHKPDPDPVLVAVGQLGAKPAEAAYVGDSPFDIQAAKAADAFAVAVGWGGIHSDETLLAEEPDAFVRAPEELLDVL
jgi:pyrophosphatase PpaX